MTNVNDQVAQIAAGPPLFLAVVAVASLAMVLALRRKMPGNPRIAMFLAILFGPAGHLYVKGAAPYVLLMYAAWIGLLAFTPLPVMVSGVLLTVLSALLMRARLMKGRQPPASPPAPEP